MDKQERLRLDQRRRSLLNFKSRRDGKAEPYRTMRRQSRNRFVCCAALARQFCLVPATPAFVAVAFPPARRLHSIRQSKTSTLDVTRSFIRKRPMNGAI